MLLTSPLFLCFSFVLNSISIKIANGLDFLQKICYNYYIEDKKIAMKR